MKFETFNLKNTPPNVRTTVGRTAKIYFSRIKCSLNSRACEIIGCRIGDAIAFHKNEKGKWYFSLDETGFKLTNKQSEAYTLQFCNAGLVDKLFNDLEIDAARVAFEISHVPVVLDNIEYWEIITKTPMILKDSSWK